MYDNVALNRDIARATIVKHWARRPGMTEGPDFVGLAGQANPPLKNLAVIGIGPADYGAARTERKSHGGPSAPTLRLVGHSPTAPHGVALRSA